MQRSIRVRRRRLLVAVTTVLALSVIAPAAASASFHLMKISEVYPGTGPCPDCSFVELQMYVPGQNFVGGHHLRTYDNTGAVILDQTLSGDVANGEGQRTILLGGSSVSNRDLDANLGVQMPPAGGAVCFESIDCVAWGNITPPGIAALPAPIGTPAPAIPSGSSLTRSISAGCATLLEDSDDTNNSAADFTLTTEETPRSNSEVPTEVACGGVAPQTVIDKGPNKRIKKNSAKFTFSSPDAGATFECALDKKPFKACTSPLKVKVKKGKHVFNVRAVVGGTPDPTPATYKFKRKKAKK